MSLKTAFTFPPKSLLIASLAQGPSTVIVEYRHSTLVILARSRSGRALCFPRAAQPETSKNIPGTTQSRKRDPQKYAPEYVVLNAHHRQWTSPQIRDPNPRWRENQLEFRMLSCVLLLSPGYNHPLDSDMSITLQLYCRPQQWYKFYI